MVVMLKRAHALVKDTKSLGAAVSYLASGPALSAYVGQTNRACALFVIAWPICFWYTYAGIHKFTSSHARDFYHDRPTHPCPPPFPFPTSPRRGCRLMPWPHRDLTTPC